jgi:tellurium resistance protein TerZ
VLEAKKKRFLRSVKIIRKPIDLDLSCLICFSDREEEPFDYLYSPEYEPKTLTRIGLPLGKLITADGGLEHSGDDQTGDLLGDSHLDNEIISVDLHRLDPKVKAVYFFLNNLGPEDFATIPYARLRIYEGSPTKVVEEFATFEIPASPKNAGHRAIIMGKLEKDDEGDWSFTAIGETTDDANFAATIFRLRSEFVG